MGRVRAEAGWGGCHSASQAELRVSVTAEAGHWKVWSPRVKVCAAPLGRFPGCCLRVDFLGVERQRPWLLTVGGKQSTGRGENPARCGPDLALVGRMQEVEAWGSWVHGAGLPTGRHQALLGSLGLEQGPANFCCRW